MPEFEIRLAILWTNYAFCAWQILYMYVATLSTHEAENIDTLLKRDRVRILLMNIDFFSYICSRLRRVDSLVTNSQPEWRGEDEKKRTRELVRSLPPSKRYWEIFEPHRCLLSGCFSLLNWMPNQNFSWVALVGKVCWCKSCILRVTRGSRVTLYVHT